ncbi:PREDICTED: uncharacterized protein LOC109179374 [Ipomoea nil]|uniref:uncharacterized protein LOC109179374 n=1 Tax=Ipomoea nil TaxID=35883 RepID=UPI0009011BAF|nr:PREDICTED: uncharacterized protein LOC109179374 [Ipomoea nil]
MSASSERTMSDGTPSSSPAQNPLNTAHHFVSMKLTYRNFLFWRTQLVPFLNGQELMGYVTGEFLCPPAMINASPATGESTTSTTTMIPNPVHKAWVKQDQTLLSLLISSLSDEVMHLAVGQTTSKVVWDSINTALASSTRAKCLGLLGQFHALRQGGSNTAEYLGRAQLLVEDLAHAGRPISLDEQNMFVLRGLRQEYRAMASSLTTAGTPVTIPQIADYLQAQEFLLVEDYPVASEHHSAAPAAFYAGRGRNSGRNSGGQSAGRGGSGNPGRGRGGGGGRGRNGGRGPRCQICRAQGHTALYCFKRYAPQPAPQANIAVPGDDTAAGSTTTGWFPDTGATAHATPDASMLSQCDEYNGGDVLCVGNGAGLTISRIGHASIASMSKVSKTLNMSNVLCVPQLSVPLLSVYRLTNDNPVYFEFHKDCFIVKDSLTRAVLLKGPTEGGLYKLPVPSSHYAFLTSRTTPVIWHHLIEQDKPVSMLPALPWASSPVVTQVESMAAVDPVVQRSTSPIPLAQEPAPLTIKGPVWAVTRRKRVMRTEPRD